MMKLSIDLGRKPLQGLSIYPLSFQPPQHFIVGESVAERSEVKQFSSIDFEHPIFTSLLVKVGFVKVIYVLGEETKLNELLNFRFKKGFF